MFFFLFVFSFFAKFWLSSQNGRSRYALTSCSPSEWARLWPALAGLHLSLQQQLGWREEGCRMLLFLHRDHKSKTNGSCLQMYGDECSYSARYRPTLSAPGFKKGIFLKKKEIHIQLLQAVNMLLHQGDNTESKIKVQPHFDRKIKNLGKVLF